MKALPFDVVRKIVDGGDEAGFGGRPESGGLEG